MPAKGSTKNLIDCRFGRLTVVKQLHQNAYKDTYWECACDCGQKAVVLGGNLRSAHSQSCGCLRDEARTTHSESNSPGYTTWQGMHQRCGNLKSRKYSDYGARGIEVCKRWEHFPAFLADMGPRPDGMTLDRIDNDGPYSPDNCRWATASQQQRNRRVTHHLELQGIARPLAEWSELTGIPAQTIRKRLASGWSVERALMPLMGNH